MRRYNKGILLGVLLTFLCNEAFSQPKYVDRNGSASFFSEAPLENIDAHSTEAMSIVNIETGEIVASLAMKSFQFKRSLMQEHFNENYIESDQFPKALFKGKILALDQIDLAKKGEYKVSIAGDMTIHGVTRPLKVEAFFENNGEGLIAKTTFPIKVADYDIEIPTIVFHNIAEEVEVKVSFIYKPLNP